LLPSQASELVEASGKAYAPGFRADDDDTDNENDDSSWMTISSSSPSLLAAEEGHEATVYTSAQGATARALVARVFALPSSLIHSKMPGKSIAVTEDDVVLFPIVGFRLVPEPRESKAVGVRALPGLAAKPPSCRIRNPRDEVLVGHWRRPDRDDAGI
jgi:hypothetical protein